VKRSKKKKGKEKWYNTSRIVCSYDIEITSMKFARLVIEVVHFS
jgi:hypothetical protein